MASPITHAAVATALAMLGKPEWRKKPAYWLAALLCSIAPDFDVIGFFLGIRYGDLWGHRGMSHSLLFAAVLAIILAVAWRGMGIGLGMSKGMSLNKDRWQLALLFFVITASHGALDALTDGGLGIAFFSPFDRTRYFFAWRPIQVSPIGARAFFSSRGMEVLQSELWVWAPASVLAALLWGWHAWREGRTHHKIEEGG